MKIYQLFVTSSFRPGGDYVEELISHAKGLKIKAASKKSCYRNVAYFIQLLSDLEVSNL